MPIPAPPAADRADRGPAAGGCDVLVVGGGPAGLATAIRLRTTTSLRVVVAESRPSPTERFGETLTPGCLAALDRLGVADTFATDGHLRCPGGISVWGRERPGHHDHLLDARGPAWHIDRRQFETRLRDRAVELEVDVRTGTRAVELLPGGVRAGGVRAGDVRAGGVRAGGLRAGGVRRSVVLRDPAGVTTVEHPAWVVDASGGGAWFARRVGERRQRLDRLVAVLRFAGLDTGPFTATTVVEATPTGWWYGSRLPGSRIVTALVTESDDARSLLQDAGHRWHRDLRATRLLGPLIATCELRPEPLRCRAVAVSALERPIGPGWLAVGDAASERDPITGSGIHDALLDAADAARTIAAELGCREPPPWDYEDRVRARFEAHLQTRAALYAGEQRWPTTTFWRRRAAASIIRRPPSREVDSAPLLAATT